MVAGVFPVDVQPIRAVIDDQFRGAVGERLAARLGAGGFGKPAGFPAADRDIDLQFWIARLERDQRVQSFRGFIAQNDAVMADLGEREDQRVDLVEITGLGGIPVDGVADHAKARCRVFCKGDCASAREQQGRGETRQRNSGKESRNEEADLHHDSPALRRPSVAQPSIAGMPRSYRGAGQARE